MPSPCVSIRLIVRYSNYVAHGTTHRSIEAGPSKQSRTLGRAAAWVGKQVDIALAAVDLSASQYRVLGLLDEQSAISSDLAQRLAVRPPSVTAIVDGLVQRGLVERRTVAGDRRRVDHVLTAAGRQSLAAADRAVAARLGEITAALDRPDDIVRAYDGLAAWREAFSAYRHQRMSR